MIDDRSSEATWDERSDWGGLGSTWSCGQPGIDRHRAHRPTKSDRDVAARAIPVRRGNQAPRSNGL